MKINKIQILGSTHLTAITCDLLKEYYDLVGFIPSSNPTISGKVNLPLVDETIEHDIKLSIQYDIKVVDIYNAYNVKTAAN